jgi:hypothetical protein
MSPKDRSLAVVASVPMAWVAVFAAFVVRARFALGRFPTPYHPDPKQLGFHWHMVAIHGLFFAALASFLVLPWAWSARHDLGSRARRFCLPLYAAGWALIGLVMLVDPGRFFDWFLD